MRHTLPARLARRAAAVTVGIGLLAGAAVAASASATAADAPAKTHDPVGEISKAVATPDGGLTLTGWAYDPDAPSSNVSLVAKLDGRTTLGSVTTSLANSKVTKKYGTGATPGYALTVTPPTGQHTLCMIAANLGTGISTPIGCIPLPLGRKWSASDIAARQPAGKITSATASSSTLRFRGYATDPDWVNAHLRVVLYVDNSPASTQFTRATANPAAGQGPNSAFDISVPVSSGTHVGCIWVVNIGAGASNTFLGCQATDTRGPAGTGPVTQPAMNKAVMAEALKHKGQPYVWGATGPKSFDCSGLVLYSYTKAKNAQNAQQSGTTTPAARPFTMTIPRVSEDQAKVARLIPASRAVPGDLVFPYDSEGDVYHVGLYVSPGKMFAAIDYGYGVNYQTIYDPSMVFYASFTHT